MKRPICIFIALLSFLSFCVAQGRKPSPKPVTFAPATSILGPLQQEGIASGDLTNNGKQDLVVTDLQNGFFTALGNGDGTFQPFVQQGGAVLQVSIVVADINEDGILDFVIPDAAQSTMDLFRGDGTGGSNRAEQVFAGPPGGSGASPVNAAAVGDLRRNGLADIVFTNSGARANVGEVGVLLGKGKGEFERQVLYHSGGSLPIPIFILDINGDGIPDLLVGNLNNCGLKNTVGVLLGNGDGTFQPVKVTNISLTGSCDNGTQAIIPGDFNGDGKPDIAVMVNGGVSIFLGRGDGKFTTPGKFYQAGCGSPGGLAADFNHDGILDLALVGNCATSYVSVLVGNGDGTFQPAAKFPVGSLPVQLTIADFNGDGKPDIAIANYLSQDVSILINTTP